MRRLMKIFHAAIMGGLVLGLLAGCGGAADKSGGSTVKEAVKEPGDVAGNETEQKQAESGKTYTANVYIYGDGSQRMMEFLQNEFKEKVQAEINVIPNVQYLPWSEYGGGKAEVMFSAGEKFSTLTDTTFMQKCISKGYYADLTESAEEHAKHLFEFCGGDTSFDAFKVDGRLYALPFGNKPNAGENYAFVVRQDLLEAVGMTEITSIADLENFYLLAKQKDPNMIGYSRSISNIPFFGSLDTEINIYKPNDFIMTDGNKKDDPTIYNFYASDEYKQCCEIMSRWVDMGVIPSYALSNREQIISEFDNGRALFSPGASYRIFEYMNIVRRVDPNAVFKNYYLGNKKEKPLMSRGTYSTAFAVGANVEGEELDAYVKTIDVLQSSRDWNDLMLFGVEGKDYEINEDGSAKKLTSDSFFDSFLPDNTNFNRYPSYVTQEMIDSYLSWNDGCIDIKTLGFAFDMENVKTEFAQMQAVEQEYLRPITQGFVDYDSNIDDALKKLENAGIDKFIAEYQKQFTEFLNNKNN